MDSPENARPNIFPRPPPTVSILMLGDIHDIAPLSVIIVSPSESWQITTGNGSPSIEYCINTLLVLIGFFVPYS